MPKDPADARQRILDATVALLGEADRPETITARQIAERAGVAVGLINYHFRSRDELLNEAVNTAVSGVAADWYQPFAHHDVDAATRLRQLIKQTSHTVMRYEKFMRITIGHGLLHGEVTTPALIVPLVREIFGSQKSEIEVRLLAYELVVTLQVAFLTQDAFRRYTGIDQHDEAQMDAMLDLLVDHLLKG